MEQYFLTFEPNPEEDQKKKKKLANITNNTF